MKNKTIQLFAVAALAALLTTTGCSDPKAKFEEARKQDSIEGYRLFVKEFPNHDLRRQADTRIQELLESETFARLSPDTDRSALKQFLLDFPESKHRADVFEMIASGLLKEAKSTHDAGKLDVIINEYSQTQAAKEAMTAKEEWELDAAWANISTMGELRQFYVSHPDYKGFERKTVTLRSKGTVVMGYTTTFFQLSIDELPGEFVKIPGPLVNKWQPGTFVDVGGGLASIDKKFAPLSATLVFAPQGHQARNQSSNIESNLVAVVCDTCTESPKYYIIGTIK